METTNKFKFVHPTRCIVAGPSGCGKTWFIQRVIKDASQLFSTPPQRFIYTYKYAQSWFKMFPQVEFTKDIPHQLNPEIPSMIVLDDVVCDKEALKECASLFIRGSHHLNSSVFFLTQNLFADASNYRMISLNTNQFVLFKTSRGQYQIETLGRQIYGRTQSSDFMKAYKDATQNPYGYLMIDLDPLQDYPLRTNIFSDEEEIAYVLE